MSTVYNNLVDPVVAPQLDSTTYASDMSAMVDVINENFRRIVQSDWLKGDTGNSLHPVKYPLLKWYEDPGQGSTDPDLGEFEQGDGHNDSIEYDHWFFTDLGKRVIKFMYDGIIDIDNITRTYNELSLGDLRDNGLGSIESSMYSVFNMYSCDGFIVDTAEDNNPAVYGLDEHRGYAALYVLYDEETDFTATPDFAYIRQCVFGGMYMYIDPRNSSLGSLNTNQSMYVDVTTSLYGAGEWDGTGIDWDLSVYNVLPTLYWNANTEYFCWKINGEYTNVSAQGIRGYAGENAHTIVCLGTYDRNNSGNENLVVNITKVYTGGGTDVQDSFHEVQDYVDYNGSIEGYLAVVWFVSESDEVTDLTELPSMTMGIVQREPSMNNDGNFYIWYNQTDNDYSNINFDFAEILAKIELKDMLLRVGLPRDPQTVDTVRGLFVRSTIEPQITSDTRVHMMYRGEDDNTGNDLYISNFGIAQTGEYANIPYQAPVFPAGPGIHGSKGDSTHYINIGYKNFYTSPDRTDITAEGTTTGTIGLTADTNVNITAPNTNVSDIMTVGGSTIMEKDEYVGGKLIKQISINDINLKPCVIWNVNRYLGEGGNIRTNYYFYISYKSVENGVDAVDQTDNTEWWKYYFTNKFYIQGSYYDASGLPEGHAELESPRNFPLLEFQKDGTWHKMYVTLLKYLDNDITRYECVLSCDENDGHGSFSTENEYIMLPNPHRVIKHYYPSDPDHDFYELLFDISPSSKIYSIPTVDDNGEYRLDISDLDTYDYYPTRISEELKEYLNIYKYSTFGNATAEMLYPNITTYHEYDISQFKYYEIVLSTPLVLTRNVGILSHTLFYPESSVIVDYNVAQYIGTLDTCPYYIPGMYMHPITNVRFASQSQYREPEAVRNSFYNDSPVDSNT